MLAFARNILRAHAPKGSFSPRGWAFQAPSDTPFAAPLLRTLLWRVPNPPGANPLVAERAPWRSSQSCATGGQQPTIGNPYRFLCHFFCTPGNPCATPIVTRGEGSFSYQGVSTRGVRHTPVRTLLYRKIPSSRPFLNPSQNLLRTLLRTLCCRTTPLRLRRAPPNRDKSLWKGKK